MPIYRPRLITPKGMTMARHIINRPDLVKGKESSLHAPFMEYFLVDGSGSMAVNWPQTMAGMTNYVEHLKSKNIRSWGIAQVFDNSNLCDIQLDCELEFWPNLSQSQLGLPGGMTPLYDAINLMVRDLAERDPQNCAITIVTDGDETGNMQGGSRHTDAAQARALLDWCRAQSWQVTFLGANIDNHDIANRLGANPTNLIGVRRELLGEAGKTLAEKRVNNIQTGNDIDFTKDEQTHFGGYLTKG
jgi:hypothetical protein